MKRCILIGCKFHCERCLSVAQSQQSIYAQTDGSIAFHSQQGSDLRLLAGLRDNKIVYKCGSRIKSVWKLGYYEHHTCDIINLNSAHVGNHLLFLKIADQIFVYLTKFWLCLASDCVYSPEKNQTLPGVIHKTYQNFTKFMCDRN